jgi:5'-3' exoribonuclease 2
LRLAVMGVPALFRWLSNKYPKIISPVIEEQPYEVDGEVIPVDTTGPNPNGEEMDNLYLDMNGIVHPCTHPEGKPPPANEQEMMLEIFKYTDRVVNMVRPRKLLLIAVGMMISIICSLFFLVLISNVFFTQMALHPEQK